jgi:hypothetical protein
MGSGIGKNAKVLNKKFTNSLERIETLEAGYKSLVEALQGTLTQQAHEISTLKETIAAIKVVVGEKGIDDAIKAARIERAEARSAAEKAALETQLSSGALVKADVISEQSVVVGKEVTADGEVIPPGRVQLIFGQFLPEFQEKLKGQSVGTTVDTPVGGKFEVTEIYDFVAAKVAADQAAEVAAHNAAVDAVESEAAATDEALTSDLNETAA